MRISTRRLAAVIGAAALSLGVLSGPAQAATATLSGAITDGATGAPIAACVSIYTAADYGYVTGTCASDTGQWSADLEAGVAYKVDINASDPYLSQWYDNAQTFDAAASVTAPATVDTALQRGASGPWHAHRRLRRTGERCLRRGRRRPELAEPGLRLHRHRRQLVDAGSTGAGQGALQRVAG
jgi:hypothetical protein